jgi:hypothetical protein
VKKFFSALFLIVFAFTAHAAGPYTAGALTNPAINAILADSGPTQLSGKNPALVVCSTVAAVVVLERRDAANAVNLYSQVFAVPASSCFMYTYPQSFDAAENERFRIRLNAAITGSIQATLFD